MRTQKTSFVWCVDGVTVTVLFRSNFSLVNVTEQEVIVERL